jgi:hypothetical protein
MKVLMILCMWSWRLLCLGLYIYSIIIALFVNGIIGALVTGVLPVVSQIYWLIMLSIWYGGLTYYHLIVYGIIAAFLLMLLFGAFIKDKE